MSVCVWRERERERERERGRERWKEGGEGGRERERETHFKDLGLGSLKPGGQASRL